MSVILNYLWRGWMLLLAIVFTPIFGFFVLIFCLNERHYRYAYACVRMWCMVMFYGMGFRYKLHNISGDPVDRDRPYIFISNHTSMMDIMLFPILCPHHPFFFVGKKELVKIPIFGTIYKRVCVMVDRKSAKSRAEVYPRCAARMAQGQSTVIYPEGGVPDDTRVVLDSFKDGAFILSSQHKFPVAVYTFVGLKEMFPFNNGKGHPGTVQVYFNGILEPESTPAAMKEKAYRLIKDTLENSN